MGGIKIPNFYASPLHDNGTTIGENTGEVKEDKKGKFVLRSEQSIAGEKGDTLRIKDSKLIKDGYLIGGDYKTKKISDKNYDLSPKMETKFSGTPVNKIDRKTKKAAKLHGRAQRVQEKAFASRDGWEENKTSKRKDKRAKKIEEKATEIKTPKLNKEQLKEASKIVEKVRTRGQKNKK